MMRRVWMFLSDPGLHVLAIGLLLIVLAIGSAQPREARENSALISCSKCRTVHYPESASSCSYHDWVARNLP